jgi:hypothetical protein
MLHQRTEGWPVGLYLASCYQAVNPRLPDAAARAHSNAAAVPGTQCHAH